MPPSSLDVLRPSYSITAQPNWLNLRDCHSLWLLFPKHSARQSGLKAAPHLLTACAADSVCPLPLSFALLTASLLLSFPSGTKIFQFPEYACTIIHGAQFGDPGFKG